MLRDHRYDRPLCDFLAWKFFTNVIRAKRASPSRDSFLPLSTRSPLDLNVFFSIFYLLRLPRFSYVRTLTAVSNVLNKVLSPRWVVKVEIIDTLSSGYGCLNSIMYSIRRRNSWSRKSARVAPLRRWLEESTVALCMLATLFGSLPNNFSGQRKRSFLSQISSKTF